MNKFLLVLIGFVVLPALAPADTHTQLEAKCIAEAFHQEALSDQSPTEAEIDKIWAVHLTDYFPDNDVLKAAVENRGRYPGTLHFALGEPVLDHLAGNWSKRKYAILTPFKNIKDQVINVLPQDTFILGSLELDNASIVFVPEHEIAPSLNRAHIIRYPENESVRDAVKKYLEGSQTIQFDSMLDQSTFPLKLESKSGRQVLIPGRSTARYFSNFLKNRPYVTTDLHERSVTNILDDFIISLHHDFLYSDSSLGMNNTSLELMRLKIENSMEEVERVTRSLTLSSSAAENIKETRGEVLKYVKLLDAEHVIRSRLNKSLFLTDFKDQAGAKKDLRELVASGGDIVKWATAHISNLAEAPTQSASITPFRLVEAERFLSISEFGKFLDSRFKSDDHDSIGVGLAKVEHAINSAVSGRATPQEVLQVLRSNPLDKKEMSWRAYINFVYLSIVRKTASAETYDFLSDKSVHDFLIEDIRYVLDNEEFKQFEANLESRQKSERSGKLFLNNF